MTSIKTTSLEALKSRYQRGEMRLDREDASAVDLPEGFWDDAVVMQPPVKRSVHLRVDEDVFAYFQEGGKGHLTRMHAVLKSYVAAQKKRDKRT
jgi:uncharacterized protein (DUF4415 family)